jgi:hypothetical protein
MDTNKQVKPAVKRKPPAAGMGRVKGSKNKVTRELKEMILGALDQAGGMDYLAARAIDTPGPFLALVGKVLPMTVQGDLEHSGGITVNIRQF